MIRRGRGLIAVFLIVSLIAAGVTRQWGIDQRVEPLANVSTTAGFGPGKGGLESMDTYALALMLGGLRGPLVMFLWYSSESQKQQHDLADFDTKVEWIRLLQPEFDTVHLFQIWNKAYNISVQMASLPNKYSTILDALDYAHSVDQQKPDDLNIISQIGALFSDKLGGSNEAEYYTRRVCEETQALPDLSRVTVASSHLAELMAAARLAGMDQPWIDIQTDLHAGTSSSVMLQAAADKLKASPAAVQLALTFEPIPRQAIVGFHAAGVKRTRLDPMLDEQGNILPQYLVPTHPRPADLPAGADWYDGSELQCIKQFEPFPYGICPDALGYNYHRRSQLLMDLDGQHHIQTSDMVIDSRPALTLKSWGEFEGTDARRAELRLFGVNDEGLKLQLQLRAPDADPNHPFPALSAPQVDPAAADRALYGYGQASFLYHDALDAFTTHVVLFPDTLGRYNAHIDDCIAFEQFYAGDHDYLNGVLHPESRQADFDKAAAEYQEAIRDFSLIILRYDPDEDAPGKVYPIDPKTGRRFTKNTIIDMPADQRSGVLQALLDNETAYLASVLQRDDPTYENLNYIARCGARLAAMGHPMPFPHLTAPRG